MALSKASIVQSLGHSSKKHQLSREAKADIRRSLLTWFAINARTLPWRIPSVPFGTTDYETYVHRLYRCLISETMLQQTQVKTVIDYYHKWLEKFPTIRDLAAAEEEAVMACWAGLGYYSRAKRLQQAAQYLVENFVSKELELPRDPEHWIKKVPGAGPYTAGAILSISFGIPSAIIDGNVQRVLSRLLAVHGDTTTPKSAGSRLLWDCAAQLVEGDEPGNLNQALMELGARVCTPTAPLCKTCPVSGHCTAYKQLRELKGTAKSFFQQKGDAKSGTSSTTAGVTVVADLEDLCGICPGSIDTTTLPANPDHYIQSLYPFRPPKKAPRIESAIVLVRSRPADGRIYLERKAAGLLAGLYDFPTTLIDPATTEEAVERRLVEERARQIGATLVGTTTHIFTHIRRTSFVLSSSSSSSLSVGDGEREGTGRWVDPADLATLGVSELCLKNWRLVLTGGSSSSSTKRQKSVVAKRGTGVDDIDDDNGRKIKKKSKRHGGNLRQSTLSF